LVPKDTNLLEAYDTFADLEAACEAFCEQVNARIHRVTRRAPADMLAEEQARLHPVPLVPHTVAFGVTRTVAAKTPMVAFDGGQYSVPAHLLGQVVWVRVHGAGTDEQVIIVHVGPVGPVEVARHGRATPGSPRLDDAHFPPPPAGALGRIPKARNESEAEFLMLGNGARLWLTEAAAAGTTKVRAKMAQAVTLSKLFSAAEVDWALGHAAVHARFAHGDLASILDHHATAGASSPTHRAGEDGSLTQGTSGWAALHTPATEEPGDEEQEEAL
ncbi:MAG TPA: IS21 family transposase, partial [Acidimicrobiales bacterium]